MDLSIFALLERQAYSSTIGTPSIATNHPREAR